MSTVDVQPPRPLPKKKVLGIGVSVGSFQDHVEGILDFAKRRVSSYVCCANAHMTVEANSDKSFNQVVNNAEFVTSDGMPLTRAVRKFAKVDQERVAGNDLFPAILKRAEDESIAVALYGGKQETIDAIKQRALIEFPELKIAWTLSPPFRALTDREMNEIAAEINQSDSQIVFVSLGCPKQEKWMAAMRGKVNAIMIGVGGAFLLYSGVDSRAPKWMRDRSMEWIYRLALEPGRLWKRYLVTNTLFVWLYFKQTCSKPKGDG